VAVIYSRGATTEALLREVGVPSRRAADLAFLLEPEAWEIPERIARTRFVAMLPSSVVKTRYDRLHGEGAYVRLLAEVLDAIAGPGLPVALIAHSYRLGDTLNSNDLPVCNGVYKLSRSEHKLVIDVLGRTPGELKYLICRSELCVTGRFHGMIAALGGGVPVVVTSWSHKYGEVLAEFGQNSVVVSVADLSVSALCERIEFVLRERMTIREQIVKALPGVQRLAQRNFEWFGGDVQTTLRRIRDR
jgi:polysaccharide pyruvyl transferase WcaK-like protein